MRLAERELAAFFRAVKELFGSELAELSAEEWLRELEATDDLPASTLEWQTLTAKLRYARKSSERLVSND